MQSAPQAPEAPDTITLEGYQEVTGVAQIAIVIPREGKQTFRATTYVTMPKDGETTESVIETAIADLRKSCFRALDNCPVPPDGPDTEPAGLRIFIKP